MLFKDIYNIPGSQAWRDALNMALNDVGGGAFNFQSSNTFYLRSGLANARRGIRNAKIGFIGDSTSRGVGAGTTSAQVPNSYPYQFSDLLTQLGYTGGKNNVFGSGNLTFSSSDSRTSISGGATTGSVNTILGGALIQLTGSGHTFSFTPVSNCDTFDVYYVSVPGGGSSNVNLDGGATLTTLNHNQAALVRKATVSGTLAPHTLNIVWASGTCYVVGVHAYNSAAKEVACLNFGASGALTANLVDVAQGYSAMNAASLAAYGFDAIVLNIGINDLNTGANLTQSLANIQTLINTYKGLPADVILVAPWGTAGSVSPNAFSFNQALYSLALSNNIPLVDMYSRMPDWIASQTAGLTFDTLHPNGVGYSEYAIAHLRAIELVV